jgi:hypothetical protein
MIGDRRFDIEGAVATACARHRRAVGLRQPRGTGTRPAPARLRSPAPVPVTLAFPIASHAALHRIHHVRDRETEVLEQLRCREPTHRTWSCRPPRRPGPRTCARSRRGRFHRDARAAPAGQHAFAVFQRLRVEHFGAGHRYHAHRHALLRQRARASIASSTSEPVAIRIALNFVSTDRTARNRRARCRRAAASVRC